MHIIMDIELFKILSLIISYRIGMDLVIKVADFGLSVNSGNKDYYRMTSDMGVKLPLKWMAPESLTDYMFSEMSDVVSTCNACMSLSMIRC